MLHWRWLFGYAYNIGYTQCKLKSSTRDNLSSQIMFVSILLFALQLLSSSLVESSTIITPCDESYPLAPSHNTTSSYSVNTITEHTTTSYHHSRNLIGIPPPSYNHNQNSIQDKTIAREYYETGEYYAPLCTDRLHIDIRYLQQCNAGACWDNYIGVSSFI